MFDSTVCSDFPIDKNYYLWVTHTTEVGKIYYIVSNKTRTEYQLWKGNKPTKYKSDNPLELNRYIV